MTVIINGWESPIWRAIRYINLQCRGGPCICHFSRHIRVNVEFRGDPNTRGNKVQNLKHASQFDRPLDREMTTRSIWLNIQIDKSAGVLLDLFVELEPLPVGQRHRIEIRYDDPAGLEPSGRRDVSACVSV